MEFILSRSPYYCPSRLLHQREKKQYPPWKDEILLKVVAILMRKIEIHGILEPKFKASVFDVLLQTPINFWNENSIDSFHQKAAAHFDEAAIPSK